MDTAIGALDELADSFRLVVLLANAYECKYKVRFYGSIEGNGKGFYCKCGSGTRAHFFFSFKLKTSNDSGGYYA